MSRIIICSNCLAKKIHEARGLCKSCYGRWWRKGNRGHCQTYAREWHRANPDYHRRWAKANLDRIKAIKARYRARHLDKCRKKSLQWHYDNRERALGNMRRYDHARRKERTDYKRRWCQANPSMANASTARYQARKRELPDMLTPEQRKQKLSVRYCFYCEKELQLTLDHFVGLATEANVACGTTLANSVAACQGCNSSKGSQSPTKILVQLPLYVS